MSIGCAAGTPQTTQPSSYAVTKGTYSPHRRFPVSKVPHTEGKGNPQPKLISCPSDRPSVFTYVCHLEDFFFSVSRETATYVPYISAYGHRTASFFRQQLSPTPWRALDSDLALRPQGAPAKDLNSRQSLHTNPRGITPGSIDRSRQTTPAEVCASYVT